MEGSIVHPAHGLCQGLDGFKDLIDSKHSKQDANFITGTNEEHSQVSLFCLTVAARQKTKGW
jgi:hypothetical protein